MTDTLSTSTQTPDTAATAPREEQPQVKPFITYAAIAGFILMILAWATLLFNEWVPLTFSVLSVVACAIGCRRPRSNMRNLAITGLLASSVLLLVLAILIGVICYFS